MKLSALAILLILAGSMCVAGEQNPIVTDLMSLKPCIGYLTSTPWGKTIDDVETMLLKSSHPDSIMRNGDMILAAYGRKSKDQPIDSAQYVISAVFKNGMLTVSYLEYFASERDASAAVKAWREVAGRSFVHEKGRENEYWTTSCPDGTKVIALGIALKSSALYTVMFAKR